MVREDTASQFSSCLQRPEDMGDGTPWAFVVLPAAVSACLPRRGRTTVDVKINGHAFRVLLEPDGRKSHWLRIDAALMARSGVDFGESASFEVSPVDAEPEPRVPKDFAQALRVSPEATETWQATTTIARLDWIHWITSARQAATRIKRIKDACDMLAAGKKRVCCFDPSGFYSKAFAAPKVAGR